MAYSPFYSGGYVDGSSGGTPISAAALNNTENGLVAAAAIADAAIPAPASPSTSDGLTWTGTAWTNGKLANANVDPAAAIAYSKLNLAGGIVNTDISGSAAIAASKIAGYPSDVTKALLGNGTWASLSGATTYRKVTTQTVNTTVSATDLLNGEITLAAGVLGTTGVARFTAWGDGLQNSGGTAAPPRFQLKLGGTTILDTGTSGTLNAGTERGSWKVEATIANQNATGTQYVDMLLTFAPGHQLATQTTNAFTTGNGVYEGDTGVVFGVLQAKGGAASSKDSTGALTLILNVINGSANAAYETKLFGALVEII